MTLTPTRITLGLFTAGAGTILLLAGIAIGILSIVTDEYSFGWLEALIYTLIGCFVLYVCRSYLKLKVWSVSWMLVFYGVGAATSVYQWVNLNRSLSSSSFQLFLLFCALVMCLLIMYYLFKQRSTHNSQSLKEQ